MHAPLTKTGLATTSVRLAFGRLIAYSTNQLPLNAGEMVYPVVYMRTGVSGPYTLTVTGPS